MSPASVYAEAVKSAAYYGDSRLVETVSVKGYRALKGWNHGKVPPLFVSGFGVSGVVKSTAHYGGLHFSK